MTAHTEKFWTPDIALLNNGERMMRKKRAKEPGAYFQVDRLLFDYDELKHQPVELEMYFNINRAALTTAEIRRIRSELEQKGRKHFRYWIHKHLNVRFDRAVRFKLRRNSAQRDRPSKRTLRFEGS